MKTYCFDTSGRRVLIETKSIDAIVELKYNAMVFFRGGQVIELTFHGKDGRDNFITKVELDG